MIHLDSPTGFAHELSTSSLQDINNRKKSRISANFCHHFVIVTQSGRGNHSSQIMFEKMGVYTYTCSSEIGCNKAEDFC